MATINSNSDSVYIDMSESLELYDKKIINGRKEQFLYALCALDYEGLPVPLSRIELWLNGLVTGDIPTVEPQSRNEQFLKAILTGDTNNLPVPQSRVEVLLNKLANGETDLTDCEPIQSRYEFLLSYLVKNGGIGVEFVTHEIVKAFEVLYNTKERPFKQATLKGNTFLNVLSEPCLKNTMTNVESQKLNHGYDAVNAVDGEFKSAILKGQTLVNLFPIDKIRKSLPSGWVESSAGVFEYTSSSTPRDSVTGDITLAQPLIAGKTYILKHDSDNTTDCASIGFVFPSETTGGWHQGVAVNSGKLGTTPKIITYTPKVDIKTVRMGRWHNDYVQNTTVNIKYPMILEYQQGMENWDIPYFEGMQSVKMPVLKTTGKNLFDGAIAVENVRVATGTGLTYPAEGYGISKLIEVKPDTTYFIQSGITSYFAFWDNNKKYIQGGGSSSIITTPSNAKYARIDFEINNVDNVQFEESSVATSYEPYKTNILSTSDDVTLRGVGGVKDTLDCLTGEVVERIGEIVLDGSQSMYNDNNGAYIKVDAVKRVMDYTNVITCDKLPTFHDHGYLPGVENGISAYASTNNHLGQNWLYVKINNSIDKDEIKQWLSQNPITVQYQLATEVVKTVDLTITDQDGATQDKLHSFNDGNINLQSMGLLPTVDYIVPTNNSYYIQDTMKLNTQYTSKCSSDCSATIDGKVIVLSANGTFITPSTIADKLIVLDREVADLMFIEGNQVDKDIPYFTGMQSVKMPILSTVGKNLFNPTKMIINDGALYGYYKYKNDESVKCTLSISDKDTSVDISNIYFGISKIGINPNNGYDWLINNGKISRPDTMCIITNFNFISMHPNNIETLNKLTKRFNIQMEYGEVKTTYEPHKTSILSLPEEVVLRSLPNGVCDTFNTRTGEYVQRIGELVLDGVTGTQDWQLDGTNETTGISGFYLANSIMSYNFSIQKNQYVISNKFKTIPFTEWKNRNTEACIDNTGNIAFLIFNSKLSEVSSNGFKQYLSQNPITVQYVLETESIKTVDLSIKDQDNQPTKLKTFNDVTYVETQAESVLPTVLLEYATKNEEVLTTLSYEQAETAESQNALSDTIDTQETEVQDTMMALTEIYEDTL